MNIMDAIQYSEFDVFYMYLDADLLFSKTILLQRWLYL